MPMAEQITQATLHRTGNFTNLRIDPPLETSEIRALAEDGVIHRWQVSQVTDLDARPYSSIDYPQADFSNEIEMQASLASLRQEAERLIAILRPLRGEIFLDLQITTHDCLSDVTEAKQ